MTPAQAKAINDVLDALYAWQCGPTEHALERASRAWLAAGSPRVGEPKPWTPATCSRCGGSIVEVCCACGTRCEP